MTPPRLPLSGYPLLHTRSLDEARAVRSSLYGRGEVETTERRTPFEWRINVAVVGPVAITATWSRGGVRCSNPPAEDFFAIAFPISAVRGEFIHADSQVPLEAGRTGFIASPTRPSECRMEPGFQSLLMVIRRLDMEAAFSALVAHTRRAPLLFEPRLLTASGAGAAVLRLLRFMIAELEQDPDQLASPLIVARCADVLLYSLLIGQPHNHTALLDATPPIAVPRCVRRAEEYMRARAAEPIRLAELAALCGVSVRSLQLGFRAHRGCTPMEFLRERRLELARTRLLHAPAGTTVAEVALGCGFEHLGRFSQRYRERYGERPAATLRRRSG